jgi:hypothetical protein
VEGEATENVSDEKPGKAERQGQVIYRIGC